MKSVKIHGGATSVRSECYGIPITKRMRRMQVRSLHGGWLSGMNPFTRLVIIFAWNLKFHPTINPFPGLSPRDALLESHNSSVLFRGLDVLGSPVFSVVRGGTVEIGSYRSYLSSEQGKHRFVLFHRPLPSLVDGEA